MRLPEVHNRVGLSTAGLTGNMVLAGVMFAGLNPWWLIVSIFMIISAIGIENGNKEK